MTGGTTIREEEFVLLPEGVIASGIITDSESGINIDNSKKLLYYVVVKYSNLDWAVYVLRNDTVKGMSEKDKHEFVSETGIKVTNPKHIKRVFAYSIKVFNFYSY